MSYGPYKLDKYEPYEGMHFSKNENWYGYTDGKHVYVDPEDGKTYSMYQTTDIDTVIVPDPDTARELFLQGKLIQYGLQTDEFDLYRDSEYCYFTPGQATYFLVINGHMDAIREREADPSFDQSQFDLETLTLTSFHRAMGLAYDRDAYCQTCDPAQSGALGLIGHAYISNPETGERYRDTDAAKLALCEVYGVNPDDFKSLDEAVDSITGYDPALAKEYFQMAYQEAMEWGYITDENNDGICDQTIRLTYSASAVSDRLRANLSYLTTKANEAAAGTPFEGKIEFVPSEPLGNEWSDMLKSGQCDICLAGWTGSAMDPFSLIHVYTNPDVQYDGAWFDASSTYMTLTLNGEKIILNLVEWTQVLNGTTITKNGKEYNFGDGMASSDVRVKILAGLEKTILLQYNHLPFIEQGSMALLSKKVSYVIDDYNPVMGRGGIKYIRYNYTDDEWEDYVDSCGGELDYTAPFTLDTPVAKVKLNSNDKPVISWGKVSGAEQYEFWRKDGANGTFKKVATTTKLSLTHTKAVPGETYSYKVRAVSGGETSEFSNTVTITVPNDLAAPVVKVKLNSSDKPVISWGKVSGAEKYEFWRKDGENGTFKKVATTTKLALTHTKAVPGETYSYKVRAVSGGETSEFSNTVTITVPKAGLDAPTVTVSNNASTGKIVVKWNKVSGAEKYELWRSTTKNGTYKKVWTGTKLTLTHGTAKPGETFYYKVRAVKGTEYSEFSAPKGRMCDLPRPVVTVTLNSKGKPVVSWKKVDGAVKYALYRSTSPNSGFTKVWTGTKTSLTHGTAVKGVTYYYKVVAICSNSSGNSAYSEVKSITAK